MKTKIPPTDPAVFIKEAVDLKGEELEAVVRQRLINAVDNAINKMAGIRMEKKRDGMKTANVKFILFHRETNTEIEMPVLSICEEYSTISFSARDEDYNGDYCGIGRLPTYPEGNDTADEYDVFVEIDGVRHIYGGEFYTH